MQWASRWDGLSGESLRSSSNAMQHSYVASQWIEVQYDTEGNGWDGVVEMNDGMECRSGATEATLDARMKEGHEPRSGVLIRSSTGVHISTSIMLIVSPPHPLIPACTSHRPRVLLFI